MVTRPRARSRTVRGTALARIRCLLCLSLVVSGLYPRLASADDWLLALPACGHPPADERLQWLYPRKGLPAVVEAGGVLTLRLRSPAALTPPPGVQQERALREWGAQLQGRTRRLRDDKAGRFQYPLRVLGFRPDGARSLVYRVRVSVPAWVAPGSYGLWVRAPGGELRLGHSVRVVAQGGDPRLAFAHQRAPLGFAADVLVTDAAAVGGQSHELLDAPVVLEPAQLVAAVRVGSTLFQLGACASPVAAGPHFVDVARAHDLRLAPLPRSLPPRGHYRWLADPGGHPLPSVPPEIGSAGSSTYLALPAEWPEAGERSLLIEGPAGVRVEGGRPRFFLGGPAGDPTAPRVLRLRLEPGSRANVAAGPLVPSAPLHLRVDPQVPRSRRVAGLSVEPDVRGMVAWDLGDGTYFNRGELAYAFDRIGPRVVQISALGADGSLRATRHQVWVETDRRSGCRLAGPSPGAPVIPAALLLWYVLRARRPSVAGTTAKKKVSGALSE